MYKEILQSLRIPSFAILLAAALLYIGIYTIIQRNFRTVKKEMEDVRTKMVQFAQIPTIRKEDILDATSQVLDKYLVQGSSPPVFSEEQQEVQQEVTQEVQGIQSVQQEVTQASETQPVVVDDDDDDAFLTVVSKK